MFILRSTRPLVFGLTLMLIAAIAPAALAQTKKTTQKKPVLKPAVTGKKTAAKTTTSTPAKTAAKSTEKPAVKTPEKTVAKTPAKTVEKAAEKAPVKAAEKTVEKTTAKVAEKPVAKKPVKVDEAPEEKKTINIVSERVWVPPVTVDKIKSDLNGRTIAAILPEDPGDGAETWQFSNRQPKEIEIIKRENDKDSMTIETRLSAKQPGTNFDGSIDTLKGVARLYYERNGTNWELRTIENVSLRHGDTGATVSTVTPLHADPVPNSTPRPAPQIPDAPPVNIVSNGMSLKVPAGEYQSYSFRVANRAIVTGRFQAYGGPQNDIEAYILDNDGFINWTNDHGSPAYYNSGRLTVGNISTPLSAGTYYLVFNNRYSRFDDKNVDANIQLRTDAGSLAGIGYGVGPDGGSFNGAGIGSITTMRRIYAPNANPVAPSVPPVSMVDPNTIAVNTNGARQVNNPPVQPRPQISEIAGYSSESIVSNTFSVQNKNSQAFSFVVKQGGSVRGSFNVIGRGDSDERNIEAYIMTANEYAKWSNYREAVIHYSSGRVSTGRITRNLTPGTYYLVFSNVYSMREMKTIQAEVSVEYNPR
jgi:hypothetical protein